MSDLLEFIEQRLTEDELWAKAASAPKYPEDGQQTVPGGVHWTWAVGDNWDPVDPDPLEPYMGGYDGQWSQSVTLRTVEEWPSRSGSWSLPIALAESEELRTADGAHIVRHDPARVLREVAAKRTVLAMHEAMRLGVEAAEGTVLAGAARVRLGAYRNALQALAAVWSDHPDYRSEWAP